MKVFFLTLLGIISISYTFSQIVAIDNIDNGFFDKILIKKKHIKEIKLIMYFKKNEDSIVYTQSFDSLGNLIKKISIKELHYRTYLKNGNIDSIYETNDFGMKYYYIKFLYNENSIYQNYRHETFNYVTISQFDSAKRLVLKTGYDSLRFNLAITQYQYEYDSLSNLKTIYFISNGVKYKYIDYKYDSIGNCIYENRLNFDGGSTDFLKISKFQQHNCIEYTFSDYRNRLLYKEINSYNGDLITQKTVFDGRKLRYVMEYEYDNDFKLIRTTEYNKKHKLVSSSKYLYSFYSK